MLSEDIYNKIENIRIEWDSEIIFFDKENIDSGQSGFRYAGFSDEIIEEWPGNEYVIIGYDPTAGCGPDPYIIKTDEKELPIYWLMTDAGDWKNPDKIANSLDDFINIIECINKNLNQISKELILEKITRINLNKNMEYWKYLLEEIPEDSDISNISKDKFELFIEEYKKITEKECYSIDLIEEEPGILDNKIGGKPYLPIGEKYPIDKFGNPMELLLQINLKDIQLENWPKSGILEIFISLEDGDYEYNCNVKLFEENQSYQTTFPNITPYPIVKQANKIKLSKDICHMPTTDYRFNDVLWKCIEKIYYIKKDCLTPVYKIFGKSNWNKELCSAIKNHLITIGGYAEFIEQDSRIYKNKNKTEVLFKLDPDKSVKDFSTIDKRILNVVIANNDILNKNFDDVKILDD